MPKATFGNQCWTGLWLIVDEAAESGHRSASGRAGYQFAPDPVQPPNNPNVTSLKEAVHEATRLIHVLELSTVACSVVQAASADNNHLRRARRRLWNLPLHDYPGRYDHGRILRGDFVSRIPPLSPRCYHHLRRPGRRRERGHDPYQHVP